MTDDLLSEDLFLLSDGKKRVGKSYRMLLRYIREGRTAASGRQVFLEAIITEGGIATSVQAFVRFRKNLNDKDVRNVRRKREALHPVRMQPGP